jgi:hypothetical protein
MTDVLLFVEEADRTVGSERRPLPPVIPGRLDVIVSTVSPSRPVYAFKRTKRLVRSS